MRQREHTRCQLQLNKKVLAGEELCTVTAPDKHTQGRPMPEVESICHTDGLAVVQIPGESNYTGPIYNYFAHNACSLTHMNQYKWA